MLPDENDTIAAIASARGPSARGVVRVAGPAALSAVARCVDNAAAEQLAAARRPLVIDAARLSVEIAGVWRSLPADLYVWPGARSYVRQPSVELHLAGSPPLLECVLRALCQQGARLAQPGEFTLRAVLSGRIDLTQAEAVLGVIDARGDADLNAALRQMAGGLAGPLGAVREDLLSLLADLEAGLDFVDEEDVVFVSPEEALRRIERARARVAAAVRQATDRATGSELSLVVITGPPNAGKSTLLNALAGLAGVDAAAPPAIVSNQAGSTRDLVSRILRVSGVTFQLVDTAGEVSTTADATIESAAQRERRQAVENAAVVIDCHAADADQRGATPFQPAAAQTLVPLTTKADLGGGALPPHRLAVSASSGAGLQQLLQKLGEAAQQVGGEQMVASTANRCREALGEAEHALARAAELVPSAADDLVTLELRTALDALGRVLGDTSNEEVLDRIFSRFCIGK